MYDVYRQTLRERERESEKDRMRESEEDRGKESETHARAHPPTHTHKHAHLRLRFSVLSEAFTLRAVASAFAPAALNPSARIHIFDFFEYPSRLSV